MELLGFHILLQGRYDAAQQIRMRVGDASSAIKPAAGSRCYTRMELQAGIARISWCATQGQAPGRILHEISIFTQISTICYCIMERLELARECSGWCGSKDSAVGRNQKSG